MRNTKRIAALAMAGAATLTALVGISPAQADRTPIGASGNSTIQLGGPVLKALQANGCGVLSATPVGDGVVGVTGVGKVNVTLPVTGFVVADTGAIRIAHANSGVDLSNSCYDVRLSGFYIQDLGGLQNTVYFDVLAKAKSADEGGDRILAFQLDVTPATPVVVFRPNSTTLKIKGMDLILATDGAAEFNQLATGDETTGPFTSGQLVGKARTSIRLQF